MIKNGYILFSLLEIITIIVGLILLICLIFIIVKQGNFLEFLNIYPKILELCIIIILSIVLSFVYLTLDFNDRYNYNNLKKCCKNI